VTRAGEAEEQGMAHPVESPSVVEAAGSPPKRIEERVDTPGATAIGVARTVGLQGRSEPGRSPDFDE
jgi:hypothetical protein